MPKNIRIDTKCLDGFVSDGDLDDILSEVKSAHGYLEDKNGPGSDYLGWQKLPEDTSPELIDDIQKTADSVKKISDVIVVIGIGGSYLGAKAAIDSIGVSPEKDKVVFAGYNLSGDHMADILRRIENKDFSINVISKSGTTTEPAIAFRILENELIKRYGAEEAKRRIICTTDKEKGALNALAAKNGYKTYVIPDDVGGRFSVLTPVGLFPAACAGIDIKSLVDGARYQQKSSLECSLGNASYLYAAVRNVLYRKGKRIEILASFDSRLHYMDEWWKQLFGESEGKGGRGIFPVSCDFSTDLHSMGQLIQQGERNLFETFLVVEKDSNLCEIPVSEDNDDNLNYLAGKQLDYVNKKAYEATREAHFEGGVPNTTIFVPERSAFCLGQLFYFFERSVAISAYIAGVNPFDQPGVEAYKNIMFKLLGKPKA